MISILVALLLLFAPQAPSPSPSPSASPSPAEKAEKLPDKDEPPVLTRHEARIGGRPFRYTVTTGTMPLKTEAGET